MPTDGTLLLEHMPKSKQYLVTALSVFFSFGAVLSAVVGLLVIPQHSCLPNLPCNPDTDNQGWRYLLMTLGLITLFMFLARIVFFRLHESPRYLVHAGRPLEAIESLQMISRFNGSDLALEIKDVADHHPHLMPSPTSEDVPTPRPNYKKYEQPRVSSTTIFNANHINTDVHHALSGTAVPAQNSNGRPVLVTQYNSTDASPVSLEGHTFATPAEEYISVFPGLSAPAGDSSRSPGIEAADDAPPASPTLSARVPRLGPSLSRSRRNTRASRRVSSMYEKTVCGALPRGMRKPLWAWWDRVMMVLSPEWLRTTLLMWVVWFSMSLSFTMFNVYLPKLLETGSASRNSVVAAEGKTLEDSLWDVVIFTIGGCPGAILGAYLIESPLGRRWSLAGSCFLTAILCVVFVFVESSWAVRMTTVGISLTVTVMWAVLYGWTPEIFGTKVRGTACGIASALSRTGGMIAPMLGGILLMIDRSVPVYTSVVIFAIAGVCVLMLREGEGESGDRAKGERSLVH
ncbi:hypothetical protein H0H81_010549 [Sphagnurus paluster]|uniref:Major facilitator superfamily (MFS) profile domain-containing protein n=1 Tax=Sphagnurus paluster TaxID=117069 RepID=A0A9P7FUT9_9AGAR|nr:hypothetical protein H0H81_010549 [Sphagnurus paluster]